MQSLTRRMALSVIGLGSALLGRSRQSEAAETPVTPPPPPPIDRWSRTPDRVWLGEDFWANPMEDWRIVNGAAECQTTGGDRNIHLVTHQITRTDASLAMSVDVALAEVRQQEGGAGFRIGIRSDINEYRSNCFSRGGIAAGVRDGMLVLGRRTTKLPLTRAQLQERGVQLRLTGQPAGNAYELTLTAMASGDDGAGAALGQVTHTVPAEAILGNVALVNNFDAAMKKGRGARYRFRNWGVSGEAFTITETHRFGPILWSMYTLSDSRGPEGWVMKLNALTGPLGEKDNHTVELQTQRNNKWTVVGTAELDSDAWTATFRIPKWDAATATPYRVIYNEQHTDGTSTQSEFAGVIRSSPEGRPLRLGALTCQNHYGFPYEPVANNVVKLDPDMLYFSGDQLYESHGGYGLIREPAEPAILNYLRKFYMFGWAFREAMRDRPTVCIPDDHDVFQGNIWGEGGKKMEGLERGASSKGGYREPARMVNVVHKTCAGHHPDPWDAEPCLQDISVYYGDLVYGGVGFAVLGDRQWKSGPEHVETGSGRADHVKDPNFDTSVLDKPGLVLLGERQEKFLREWADDWRGHTIKVLLSQTVFAGVATHHGNKNGYLKADLDSGGWPQTARNQAINIIRKAQPLHINGDQHLTTLSQYGVEAQRDSFWSFCTPAIAAGYPRWWRPDEMGMKHANRPQHGLDNTGEFIDGFGNKVYVYAVGNPEVGRKKNRYELAHQKGSGFGLVTIDPAARTYQIESFRFLIDATDGKDSNQFPGWPVTLHQKENGGENLLG